ncbi:unnamed protein product [Rotaria sordida]|uniref:Reverse transcriptase domain-containing protein n=3 Tax=Rotaria sordida TaxID=392033 RepID=A0A819CDH6_9BILA|nr:unnamed protein product [Rotaria sordida]
MPPKIIDKVDFSFKIDESIISQDEVQAMYNQMRQITKDFRIQTMKLYVQSAARENEILSNEIKTIINEANIQLTEEEHQLLRLGSKFIFNDPKTAARRRITVLATLKRKIEKCFLHKKVSPGRPLQQFIAELDVLLQTLHNVPTTRKNLHKNSVIVSQMNQNDIIELINSQASQSQVFNLKSDKSKVFHLGKIEDYRKKSKEYIEKTQAYKYLGNEDRLPDLIQRTNKYLLDLRLTKWITQKQYELLSIKPNEVELAHLYYSPKAHKSGTPQRPIISGLKHSTIKISKFLDDLLRPLFDKMTQETTVTSGFELVKKLNEWSKVNMNQNTIFCTIDGIDLYTMIPHVEGVLSLKKMLDYLKLKKANGFKVETIIRLSRFVMQNNYFSYDGQFYHQIRDGAMGSPLTLTMANCYMFFFERALPKQIKNGVGLYFRYIDDLFIVINWSTRYLLKQIDRWNKFDENIKLHANIGAFINFLDLYIYMENRDGTLCTTVYQKPSYESYYLPFNSIHPLHMKKNIPFTMLLCAIRYCSTYQTYLDECEKLRMTLLLNKYPNKFIEQQFNSVLLKYSIDEPLNMINYDEYRQNVLDSPSKEHVRIDYDKVMLIHFTYCLSMKAFPLKFHTLWSKYFGESPINEIIPVLGTRNVKNL